MNSEKDIEFNDEPIFLYGNSPNQRLVNTPSPIQIKPNHNEEILNLLKQLVCNETQLNKLKLSIHLSDKSIQIIQLFLKHSPEIFIEIANDVQIILSDGVLDISDLPQIILLIKDVYNINFKKINKKFTVNESIQFIQDFILLLIELNYFIVNDKIKVIKIIDSSVQLLMSSIQVAPSLFKCCVCCL